VVELSVLLAVNCQIQCHSSRVQHVVELSVLLAVNCQIQILLARKLRVLKNLLKKIMNQRQKMRYNVRALRLEYVHLKTEVNVIG